MRVVSLSLDAQISDTLAGAHKRTSSGAQLNFLENRRLIFTS